MRSNVLMIVMIMGLIGCSDVKGGGPATHSRSKYIPPVNDNEKIESMYKYAYKEPVQINLDDMTFSDAFNIQYRAKGEGHTFWWNGDEYTTDLYDSVDIFSSKWVLNADDTDDTCYENKYDECGICNGVGPLTWYFDFDGDGLGDPNKWTKKCTYPSVDEE